jgi:Mg2+ and Co2+ transporter CorA
MIRTVYRDAAGAVRRDVPVSEFAAIQASGVGTLWVDVFDPKGDEVDRVCAALEVHPLAVEDMHHLGQFPKLDDFGRHLFLVTHTPQATGEGVDFVSRAPTWCSPITPNPCRRRWRCGIR